MRALGPIHTIRNAAHDVEGLDWPFTLDVIVKDWIVDACIDGGRTMVTRRHELLTGGRLFLFAVGRSVMFEDIAVRPLD